MAHPHDGIAELSARLGLADDVVRDALARLSALALVRSSGGDRSGMRAVDPRLGMEILLARQQAELMAQQQKMEATRAAAAELIAEYADVVQPASAAGVRFLSGIDAIRDQLELVTSEVERELWGFAPGGPQTPENMKASRPLNQQALDRGVEIKTIYLDSIRRDQPSFEHALWLESAGAQVRTVPTLPNRVVIVDRRTALVATNTGDTGAGAALITNSGLLALLCSLFDHVWQSAEPLGPAVRGEKTTLSRQQLAVLMMMAEGRTDESIATSMAISTRTVRRIVTGLLADLNVRNRFQAAVRAVQLGYLPATPD
ncbi:LuxR C-terminal-related transcriptional regulator [Streptomyces sp. NPDC096339]|uniref:helix-turn-helix transcriptional regulator n=1 Tax=Streptomyces sp. NPDC096339 TaxID=3366086 RepID=UPI003810128C